LHIIIFFFTWCLLFNLLLDRKEVDVEDLMQAIQIESMQNVHAWINCIMVRKRWLRKLGDLPYYTMLFYSWHPFNSNPMQKCQQLSNSWLNTSYSFDVVLVFDIKLTCRGFGQGDGGKLPCIYIWKAKFITFVSYVIV
jgi:hypothetical protein